MNLQTRKVDIGRSETIQDVPDGLEVDDAYVYTFLYAEFKTFMNTQDVHATHLACPMRACGLLVAWTPDTAN